MFFEKRRYTVRAVETAGELAAMLSDGRTWTLCTGFAYGGALFLNDSSSEDGAGEWAVLTLDGVQVESVTFGWMSVDEAERFLVDTLPGVMASPPIREPKAPRIQSYGEHSGTCRLCA